jgi:TPR repeat protein
MESGNYDFDTAIRLMEQKNYGDVWKYALPHANAGDSNAQCLIAFLYQFGLGGAPDVDEAERWMRKACEQNNPVAWNNLGSLYAARLPELAHRWGDAQRCYEKAKELGFDCANPYPPRVEE